MSVRPEMLCDGKTRRILVNSSEMFTKTFLPSAPSLADVNGRAATAGDAVNQTGGQASEGISWLSDPLAPEDRFRRKYGHKYGNVSVDIDKYLRVLQPAFLSCELEMFASYHQVETQPLVVEER